MNSAPEFSTSMLRNKSEELLRQLSNATKNQLGHPKSPTRGIGAKYPGGISCPTLVLYGTRAPIIDSFRAWKPPIPYAINNQRGASSKAPSRDSQGGSLWHKRAGVATLCSSRPMRAEPRHFSTNESGEHCSAQPKRACHRRALLSIYLFVTVFINFFIQF